MELLDREKTLNGVKLFIFEENRDFNKDNQIWTVSDTVKFIEGLVTNEVNSYCMSSAYRAFLYVLGLLKQEEFLTLSTFMENDLCQEQ